MPRPKHIYIIIPKAKGGNVKNNTCPIHKIDWIQRSSMFMNDLAVCQS